VGGARTAIFNWLIARQSKGRFLLRIEDTDRERSTRESIDQIIKSLTWLDLQWDGEIVYQSRRLERHKELVQELLREHKAYPCFCTKEELAERRQEAEKQGQTFRYDRRCLNLPADQVEKKIAGGVPHAVRLHIPDEDIRFDDRIHGPTTVRAQTIDDFIIQRMDGTPVYQMAVVADDHDMGVTLVLRGDDHLSNTPKQILIYRALGWESPAFAHVPMILGPDKVRLSKRHGATSIEEFREMGILPEALFNYLCLLGWAPGDDSEVMSRQEIIDRFELSRINKSAAVFDVQKLRWMNRKYLAGLPFGMVRARVLGELQATGFRVPAADQERFDLLIRLYQQRSYTMTELFETLKIFFEPPGEYDEKGKRKYFNASGFSFLNDLRQELQNPEDPLDSIEEAERFIRGFAEQKEVSAAKIIHPLRLALTGKTESPGIFELLYIFGRTRVLERLETALSVMASLKEAR
jgi:glutamyl-tRNA synthetase